MHDANDDEFFDLFDGIDDNVPGPSDAFASGLFEEIRAGFDSTTEEHPLPLGDATDAPLFDLDGSNSERPNTGWLMAAAVVLIGLLATGFLLLNGGSEGDAVVASQGTSAPTSAVANSPSSTDQSDSGALALAFSTPLGFTEVAEDVVSAAFMSNQETVFNATLRTGGQVVETTSGSASPDTATTVMFDRLTPSTTYSLEITLLGSPSVLSPRLEVRTAGEDTPISITELTIIDRTPSGTAVTFATNLCARASLVILDASDQREVLRISSAADGPCSLDHVLAIGAGQSLEPGTDYVLLVDAVASNGEPGGRQNVTSESTTLRTEG